MPMGMNRVRPDYKPNKSCVPHAYGDEPAAGMSLTEWTMCSPCLWG